MNKSNPLNALYQYALRCLAKRAHSTEELIQKLKRKSGILQNSKDLSEKISQVILGLKQKNLLNDAEFAENYSRMRMRCGYGKLRIQAELKQRGIMLDSAYAGLNSFNNHLNLELTMLKKTREKKFGKNLPANLNDKAKQARYLSYKGFSFEDIKSVLNDRCLFNHNDISHSYYFNPKPKPNFNFNSNAYEDEDNNDKNDPDQQPD